MTLTQLEKVLYSYIKQTIEKVGVKEFKKTSLFMSNNKELK